VSVHSTVCVSVPEVNKRLDSRSILAVVLEVINKFKIYMFNTNKYDILFFLGDNSDGF